MTDILDEILAYTEGIQKREQQQQQLPQHHQLQQQHHHHHHRDQQHHQLPHPPSTSPVPTHPYPAPSTSSALVSSASAAAAVAANLQDCRLRPTPVPPHYISPSFAPSPRGIQDDFSPFAILPRPPPPPTYHPKSHQVTSYPHPPTPHPHTQSVSNDHPTNPPSAAAAAAAAAVAAAAAATVAVASASTGLETMSVSRPTHPPTNTHHNIDSTLSTPSQHGPVDVPSTVVAPSHPPAVNVHFDPQLVVDPVDDSTFHVAQGPWSTATKRPYHHTLGTDRPEQPPPLPPPPQDDSDSDSDEPTGKRHKLETSCVMPPSAKSILERRERAIREGRRKDAKLTDAERRILRRLRNRESAERCRLRRVQQAVQLERKIESMQVENDRLVAVADEYEKTIKRLEKIIEDFNSQKNC